MTHYVTLKTLIAVLWLGDKSTSLSPTPNWRPDPDRFRIYNYEDNQVSSYSISEQRCCLGNIFSKTSNSYKRCCGGSEYDSTTEACCGDTVFPKQIGFDCCDRQYFNVTENMCCRSGARPRIIKFPDVIRDSTLSRSNSQCCGAKLYDTRVQLCCPLPMPHTMSFRLVDKLYPNTICCKGKAFNAQSGRCNENLFQILPFPRPTPIQLPPFQPFPLPRPFPPPGPFNGRPPRLPSVPMRPVPISRPMPRPFPFFPGFPPPTQPEFGSGVGFSFGSPVGREAPFQRPNLNQCNGKRFNAATHLCCGVYNPNNINPENDLVIVSRSSVTTVCCGIEAYDFTKQTCCNGQVHTTDMENPKTCCGKELYDPATQWCCDAPTNTIAAAREVDGDYCCGADSIVYSYDRQICCGGQLLQIPEGADSAVVECCAGSNGESPDLYNTTNQKCCDGSVVDLPDGVISQRSQHLHCCGKNLINIRRTVCCNGMPMQRMGNQSCCRGNAVYNTATQMCCNKVVEKETARHTVCCGEKALNPATEICCDSSGEGTTAARNRSFNFQLCCAGTSYDPTQQTCCNGELQSKDVLCCSIFNDEGTIEYSSITKTNSSNRCCGLNEYNPRSERCCKNTVVSLNGDNHFCCGSSPYNSATQICCGETIFEKEGDQPINACCGNLAYNTTVDVCCGGHVKNRIEGKVTGCCFPHQLDWS